MHACSRVCSQVAVRHGLDPSLPPSPPTPNPKKQQQTTAHPQHRAFLAGQHNKIRWIPVAIRTEEVGPECGKAMPAKKVLRLGAGDAFWKQKPVLQPGEGVLGPFGEILEPNPNVSTGEVGGDSSHLGSTAVLPLLPLPSITVTVYLTQPALYHHGHCTGSPIILAGDGGRFHSRG